MVSIVQSVGRKLRRYPILYRVVCMTQGSVRRPYRTRQYLRSARGFTGLQIGAGNHELDGWFKTDLEPDLKAVYLDATKRFPFADDTFDYIVAEHIIEHISYEDGLKMLRECHRVLKKKGVVRIATPNIDLTHRLMHLPLAPELERYVAWSHEMAGSADPAYSAIHVINRLHHAWGHQFLYDADTLVASFRRCGFVETIDCAPNKSTHAALADIDRHALTIGEESNELESLIIEATK
jgi:predicted SAM-dependent methyltransferase